MSTEELPETIAAGKGVTMTFLRDSEWIVRNHATGASDEEIMFAPPHWHETHDEIFRVCKGEVEFKIGSSVKMYGPDDGEARIPKGVVHSLRSYPGVECILEERTEPMDDEKEMFFRNMLARGTQPTDFFEIMHIMYHGDGRPAFPGHFRWLERGLVTVVGGYIAPMLGYKRKYQSLKKL